MSSDLSDRNQTAVLDQMKFGFKNSGGEVRLS